MGKYDDLLSAHYDRVVDEDTQFARALSGMQEMAVDASRTAELYRNTDEALAEIDEQFLAATKLDRADVAFLMLATALQISRWIVIRKINESVSNEISDSRVVHNDKSILEMEIEKRDAFREKHGTENTEGRHRDWVNIVYNGVPYDITRGSPAFGVNMQGGLHRIHTLGHDPVLGWIFGTMNILSDTITLEDFRTFSVCMLKGHKRWVQAVSLSYGFVEAVDSIKEDSNRLPAALFAQALHLESDVFTKQGLPVPVLEAFAPEFAGKVYKEGYDTLMLMNDIAVVGVQTVASVVINMLIAALHGLFYDTTKYPDRDLFEVKTRKILSISNVIASSSNVIWVGGNAWMGNESAWKDLDIGGILVTAYRLVTDAKFITRVKKEYLASEWQKRVVGEEYSFMTEASLMSKKDIRKGIAIQARADAAKQDKVASGLEKQAEILEAIEADQREVQGAVGVVLQDKAVEEAKELYGIDMTKSLCDLGSIEKQALCATLYTLMDQYGQNADDQRAFYLNLENYLGVSKRFSNFDFEKLNNVDSHADRREMLKVICAFLSLGDPTFAFKDDTEHFGWLSRFTSSKDVDAACEEVRKELSVLGVEGIVIRYKAIDAPQAVDSNEVATAIETAEPAAPVLVENNFSGLKRILSSYLADETAFGKKLESLPTALQKELQRALPMLNLSTILYGTKIANGYLLFSTHAMYLKEGAGLKSTYLRIPYVHIIADKLATAAGRAAGTRKLLITFKSITGSEKVITIDDSRVTEERLLALLKEIVSSRVQVAETDFNLDLPELSKEEQLLYFKALGNILTRGNRSLTELYLIVRDYGLENSWNEIAQAFTDDDALSGCIQAFIDGIPYPSAEWISEQAVVLALQTLFRTNRIEKQEASMLPAEAEALIRMFIIGDMEEKRFNEMIKAAAESKRKMDLQTVFALRDQLPEDTLFRNQVSNGLNVIINDLEQAMQNKKKTISESIKDAAQAIPGSAGKALNNAGRFMDSLRNSGKKETLTLPPQYQKLKQKFPEGIGIPKNAVGYGMRTEAASGLLISYPVTEETSMPFGNPQWVIDQQHQTMGDNEGLIEVVSGTTVSGRPYIYEIVKHRLAADKAFPCGVEYTLNINVRMENSIQFINGSFMEEGTTGIRDSICMAIYAQANNQSMEEALKDWFKDPYDPAFRRGFLMNQSERPEFDEKFPSHPLSEVRALARFIVENN